MESTVVVLGTFAVGLVLLIKGSDLFIEAAARVAKGFGVSEFLIALVLASVATTLPEVTVSALAALRGSSDIALGNAIGSALANIALILGVASMIFPLDVDETSWKHSVFLVAITAYVSLLMLDGTIGRLDGLSLILIYLGFLYYLYREHMSLEPIEAERGNPKRDVLILFGSGLLVVVGAKLVVNSAVEIARAAGISEVVIGLTLVSIGTSLPEFTNAVMAAIKRLPNISVGNIIGADILDILMVIGIASLIRPIKVDPKILHRTVPLTLLVMLILTFSLKRNNRVGRKTGLVFLSLYALFLYLSFSG